MNNKIIIVGGYCATGKSVFARKLSGLLNIPCFIKDVIKEVLGDGFGPENDMVEKKGSAATFLLMLHIAERFLQTGNVCILESNFKAREIEQLKVLLEKYNAECLTYIFKGDFDVLFERYMKRDTAEKRHWVHNTAGETAENFREGHLQTGIGETGIGQTINIDSTSFANVNYDDLFARAKDFIASDNQ
ncbi:MAG: ATP-binding protein [Treponema sp.]|jgi:predicted kinase|nr:ATP-binding protein [Treponema sp.]